METAVNIAVIGGGYVGLVMSTVLAHKGHRVLIVDVDERKVAAVNKGEAPVYERDLGHLLRQVVREGRLGATLGLGEALLDMEICYMCVGTPSGGNGGMDLSQVVQASKDIGRAMSGVNRYVSVAVKSTVIPGTTDDVVIPLIEEYSGKKAGEDFGVCVNPEFLREGSAVQDFLDPSSTGTVIGRLDDASARPLIQVYREFPGEILVTCIREAETIKYARNAYLAKDVSFANELANFCRKVGVDYEEVKRGMKLDRRIGFFIDAGIGWGGSCFTKDAVALMAKARELGVEMRILDAALRVNREQPLVAVEIAREALHGLKGKRITVLGLAFKPGTDDVRESRSIPVVEALLSEGAMVTVYDPKVDSSRIFGRSVKAARSLEEAMKSCDACIIATGWEEFRNPGLYKGCVVVDGRRVLDPTSVERFYGVGYPR